MNTNTILISSALCADNEAHGASTHRKFSGFSDSTGRVLIVDICSKCARDLRKALDAEVARSDEEQSSISLSKQGNVYVSGTGFGIEIASHKSLVSTLVKAIGRETDGQKRLRWYLICDRSSTQAQIDRAEDLHHNAWVALDAAMRRAQGLSTER
jgi:hypothetical protein